MRRTQMSLGRPRACLLLVTTLAVALSFYIEQVVSLPVDTVNQWPTLPRRNIAALARGGYLRNSAKSYKRGISTLAKNGLLPTYRSPYDDSEKSDQSQEESQEKRNMASIARLRSFYNSKRNIQALARDGYIGRGQYNSLTDKRNIAALARNGLIHKKDETSGDEYYYPFYQNSVPPLTEIDRPYDINEIYDYQQSINPDMFPPLSQLYKRSFNPYDEYANQNDANDLMYSKKSFAGSPVHGLFRPMYAEPNGRSKRYVLPFPDYSEDEGLEHNDITDIGDKRSIGSIPLTRISELGNISLVPRLTQSSVQTTPTYRRQQYLLTRTRPAGSSTDR